MGRRVIVASNNDDFVQQASWILSDAARRAIAARGVFSIALCGGSTVRGPYELFASAEHIDWNRVLIFFGDDRFVDFDNPYSNYKQASEVLIERAGIPARNVFPMPVNAANPELGAREYARIIREQLSTPAPEIPIFDLVHLGMGPDGHTASLFPHSRALSRDERQGIIRMNHAGFYPWVDRLTFSVELINNARCVFVTATGRNKASRIREVLEGIEIDIDDIPIAAVAPTSENLIWLLDSGAAAGLKASTITG